MFNLLNHPKAIRFLIVFVVIEVIAGLVYLNWSRVVTAIRPTPPPAPLVSTTDKNGDEHKLTFGSLLQTLAPTTPKPQPSISKKSDQPYHLLILGLDRRSRNYGPGNTDTLILLSFSADRSVVVLTSIPRDLWLDSAKINAFYAKGGFELIREKVWEVTGFMADNFVAVDFDALVWMADSMGELRVEVERSFVDSSYPNDRGGGEGLTTISFNAGTQLLSGEEVLQYSRSRKGSNSEGSDFARMARQQQVLKALPAAFLRAGHRFYPFNVASFYTAVSQQVETDLSLADIQALYEMLGENYETIQIEEVVLSTDNFLFHPPNASYGGAYVLRPRGEDFAQIREFLKTKLP